MLGYFYMNKTLLFVIVLVLVILGGRLVIRQMGTQPASTTPQTSGVQKGQPVVGKSNVEEMRVEPTSTVEGTFINENKVKKFAVTGSSFKFSLSEIRVKKGDTVKILFTNTEGFHDWVIDEFNARTPQIAVGKTETVTFVADQTGTFEYYCSVGAHRANGMKGNLIVEE